MTLRYIVTRSNGFNDARGRVYPQAAARFLTTIVTTIELDTGWFTAVRWRSVCRPTCIDVLR
jgi:hypothetical protein